MWGRLAEAKWKVLFGADAGSISRDYPQHISTLENAGKIDNPLIKRELAESRALGVKRKQLGPKFDTGDVGAGCHSPAPDLTRSDAVATEMDMKKSWCCIRRLDRSRWPRYRLRLANAHDRPIDGRRFARAGAEGDHKKPDNDDAHKL